MILDSVDGAAAAQKFAGILCQSLGEQKHLYSEIDPTRRSTLDVNSESSEL
jgi:hypothetical protein